MSTANGTVQSNGNGVMDKAHLYEEVGVSTSWEVDASVAAAHTFNPIRAIVDVIKIPATALFDKATDEKDKKKIIPLSIGDPTLYGNLKVPDQALVALQSVIMSGKHNRYAPSVGSLAARQAVIDRYSFPSKFYKYTQEDSEKFPPHQLTPNDVIITSGCSGALSIAIEGIANPGDNILIPRPGFSLYGTICGRNNIEVRYYDLNPSSNWEIDLQSLRKGIDSKTKAILVNNPSNPTGANWSAEHILDILKVAEEFKLPIIADEVYADMVFEGETFYPFAALSKTVPILAVGGIAKQFVCPGWRVGWLIIYEKSPFKSSSEASAVSFRLGLNNLSQIIIGCNTLIQGILPNLLLETPTSYLQSLMANLQESSLSVAKEINSIEGLKCCIPQGAMYIMVELDCQKLNVKDDRQFAQELLNEELVFALPGACFQAPGFVRLVTCAPVNILLEACSRIRDFCARRTQLKN